MDKLAQHDVPLIHLYTLTVDRPAPLLTYDGTAAQEPGDHHQPSCQDQDVGGHGECIRGQQAQVLSFIDQRPDPNTHHHPAAHLEEKNTSRYQNACSNTHITSLKG